MKVKKQTCLLFSSSPDLHKKINATNVSVYYNLIKLTINLKILEIKKIYLSRQFHFLCRGSTY